MQFPTVNILIVPTKNDFMNEIGAFVTVYTQIPTSNLKSTHVVHLQFACSLLRKSFKNSSRYCCKRRQAPTMMRVFNIMNFMLLESAKPSKTKSQTARQAARSIEVCMKKLGFRPKNMFTGLALILWLHQLAVTVLVGQGCMHLCLAGKRFTLLPKYNLLDTDEPEKIPAAAASKAALQNNAPFDSVCNQQFGRPPPIGCSELC